MRVVACVAIVVGVLAWVASAGPSIRQSSHHVRVAKGGSYIVEKCTHLAGQIMRVTERLRYIEINPYPRPALQEEPYREFLDAFNDVTREIDGLKHELDSVGAISKADAYAVLPAHYNFTDCYRILLKKTYQRGVNLDKVNISFVTDDLVHMVHGARPAILEELSTLGAVLPREYSSRINGTLKGILAQLVDMSNKFTEILSQPNRDE